MDNEMQAKREQMIKSGLSYKGYSMTIDFILTEENSSMIAIGVDTGYQSKQIIYARKIAHKIEINSLFPDSDSPNNNPNPLCSCRPCITKIISFCSNGSALNPEAIILAKKEQEKIDREFGFIQSSYEEYKKVQVKTYKREKGFDIVKDIYIDTTLNENIKPLNRVLPDRCTVIAAIINKNGVMKITYIKRIGNIFMNKYYTAYWSNSFSDKWYRLKGDTEVLKTLKDPVPFEENDETDIW